MAKHQISLPQKPHPDVDGALAEVRSKKSREQVKAERFVPFVPVVEAALRQHWKWSPILQLIRKRGGPSLTKAEAERLYEASKPSQMSGQFGVGPASNAGRADASGLQREVSQ